MQDRKEYLKNYRIKNKEKIKELNRKWYEDNKEKVNSDCKEYYKNNIDIIKLKKEKALP